MGISSCSVTIVSLNSKSQSAFHVVFFSCAGVLSSMVPENFEEQHCVLSILFQMFSSSGSLPFSKHFMSILWVQSTGQSVVNGIKIYKTEVKGEAPRKMYEHYQLCNQTINIWTSRNSRIMIRTIGRLQKSLNPQKAGNYSKRETMKVEWRGNTDASNVPRH